MRVNPAFRDDTMIVTGADRAHFANLRVLAGSWRANMGPFRLAVCDFGLEPDQIERLRAVAGIEVLAAPEPVSHPWLGKALVGRFLEKTEVPWRNLVWLDADALFAHSLPELAPLLEGYDLIADAHVQSVGEIVEPCNLAELPLRPDDAYFAAGWWVARRGCLLESYERFCRRVMGRGNLWEGDAFVAAIYSEKLKVRTVSGSVWHCRGRTSLPTCEVRGLEPFHAGQPIYVLHANDGYDIRADGRRVFRRPELAAIQDHYDALFDEAGRR
ncbi:MAG: hypothetical protein ACREFX_00445 [Opitutaceae bacterium]